MIPAVLAKVLERPRSRPTLEPAVLYEYRRHRLRTDEHMAAIDPQQGWAVRGMLVTGLDHSDVGKLQNHYLEQYQQTTVKVRELKRSANKYVPLLHASRKKSKGTVDIGNAPRAEPSRCSNSNSGRDRSSSNSKEGEIETVTWLWAKSGQLLDEEDWDYQTALKEHKKIQQSSNLDRIVNISTLKHLSRVSRLAQHRRLLGDCSENPRRTETTFPSADLGWSFD
ncbi:MAG: hypothetical protein Q9162_001898 [Coniocarpon cinnabarinum]